MVFSIILDAYFLKHWRRAGHAIIQGMVPAESFYSFYDIRVIK